MATLSPAIKLRVYLAACTAWLCAGTWLVACVAMAAPLRVGFAAALSVVLLGVAVGFIKHDMELDLIRTQAQRPVRVGADDDWEKGEA